MQKNLLKRLLIFTFPILLLSNSYAVQDDPVIVPHVSAVPTIDGDSADACWTLAAWQPIDQTWIPYGVSIPASDFTGRFKVIWSSVTNRVYFLVDITDNIFVKGYDFPMYGWWDYDCVEIFFDEDNTHEDHTYNTNAFAYHITAGNNTDPFEAIDIGSDQQPVDYTSHMNCVISHNGTHHIWEIELKVYDKNLNLVTLTGNKVCGFTMAYCDTDDLTIPPTRDHFFGSVYTDQANSNSSWQNTALFGHLQLGPVNVAVINTNNKTMNLDIFPIPCHDEINIKYTGSQMNHVEITVFDLTGRAIYSETLNKDAEEFKCTIPVNDLPQGIYLFQLRCGNHSIKRKISVMK